jgi:two-component system sensor histidine kinase CpxA
VLITIRDHGPGVAEESLEHLFLPFYRVDEARDRRSGGSGLGLAITKRAITLHGGSVSAANAAGGGLEVRISLPMEHPV